MTAAEFARTEAYREGYDAGHREASFDGYSEGHHRGFVLGLQAGLDMLNRAAEREGFVDGSAMHRVGSTIRERIQAGGCEPGTHGRWAQ